MVVYADSWDLSGMGGSFAQGAALIERDPLPVDHTFFSEESYKVTFYHRTAFAPADPSSSVPWKRLEFSRENHQKTGSSKRTSENKLGSKQHDEAVHKVTQRTALHSTARHCTSRILHGHGAEEADRSQSQCQLQGARQRT